MESLLSERRWFHTTDEPQEHIHHGRRVDMLQDQRQEALLPPQEAYHLIRFQPNLHCIKPHSKRVYGLYQGEDCRIGTHQIPFTIYRLFFISKDGNNNINIILPRHSAHDPQWTTRQMICGYLFCYTLRHMWSLRWKLICCLHSKFTPPNEWITPPNHE